MFYSVWYVRIPAAGFKGGIGRLGAAAMSGRTLGMGLGGEFPTPLSKNIEADRTISTRQTTNFLALAWECPILRFPQD